MRVNGLYVGDLGRLRRRDRDEPRAVGRFLGRSRCRFQSEHEDFCQHGTASMVGPRCFDVGIALQVQLVRITNPQTCKLSRATACTRKSNVALPPRCTVRSGGYPAFERGLPMTMVSFGQPHGLLASARRHWRTPNILRLKIPKAQGFDRRGQGPRPRLPRPSKETALENP